MLSTHFPEKRQIAQILLVGQGRLLLRKPHRAASSQKKALDAAIAHRQKTLLLGSRKSGERYSWGICFIDKKSSNRKKHTKVSFRYISFIRFSAGVINNISKVSSVYVAPSCARRNVRFGDIFLFQRLRPKLQGCFHNK